jgi:hypothetical protein
MAKPGLKPIPGIVESAPLALTKADLETRRAELIKARDEMAANLQALSGAIQQVELFIKSLADRESLTRKAEEEKQNANPVPTVK